MAAPMARGAVGPAEPPRAAAGSGPLDRLFSIDLRSLAAFRIAVGAALLYDVLDRSRDLIAHYTERGVLPVETLVAYWGTGAYGTPFFYLSGSSFAVALLFAALGAAAAALVLGWRTRVVAVLCWVGLAGLQARNPLVANMGGDNFLRMLLFWGMFLPLGARFSLDARRRPGPPAAERELSVASAALLLQIALMYVATGLLKSGETWRDGTAVTYALRLDIWVTSLGQGLREFEALHRPATLATRWLEVLGPLLAFSPVATGPARLVAVAIFTGFHLGLAAFLGIGPFPLFCIIAWTAFLPPVFWDRILPRILRLAPSGAASTFAASTVRRTGPRWAQGVAGVLLLYCVVQVGWSLPQLARGGELPTALLAVGRVLRINQHWGMFAPNPSTHESWPVFHGRLAGGAVMDPLRGAAVLDHKPLRVSDAFPSFRWKLYLVSVMQAHDDAPKKFEALQRDLVRTLCDDWNARHSGGQTMESIAIEYWSEENRLAEPPLLRNVLYRADCNADM
jgi:hypothetical protein